MNVLGAPLLESVPWLLAVALCFAAAASPWWRATRGDGLTLAALTLASVAYRVWAFPTMFFHQNGQGPLWVEHAILGTSDAYGPGVVELFHGAIARTPTDPDGAVFAVQGLLAAFTPACAWILARRVGADRARSLVLAAAVAFDPVLARLSRSESYLGTGASLLFMAAAMVSLPATRGPWKSPRFVLASVASAMFVAQAARLQPILWVPAALTPLALLLSEGALRRRLRGAVASALIIAAVVVSTSGGAMWRAYHSELSGRMSQYLHAAFAARYAAHLAWAAPLAVTMVLASRARRRAWLVAPLAVAVIALADWADFFAANKLPPWIQAGYARLYAPAAVALAAALTKGLARSRRGEVAVAAALAAALAVTAAVKWRGYVTAPTDAREQNLARAWIRALPDYAHVAYHCRAGSLSLVLPMHPWTDPRRRDSICLEPGRREDPPEHTSHYYRSSACATAEGRPRCEAFEARYVLAPVAAWTLPAIASYHVPYEGAAVRVGLFRIVSRRDAR